MTALAWRGPLARSGPEVAFDTVASPLVRTELPWILFVGSDRAARENAALAALSEATQTIAPPTEVPLVIAIHELPAPAISGPRALYLPELDRGFHDPLGSIGSPVYVLAKAAACASAEENSLSVIATAEARGSRQLLEQRGLASRFEIRRIGGDVDAPYEPPALPRPEQDTALAELFRAAELTRAKDVRNAVQALKRAVAIDPSVPAAHYELGKALIQADALEGAVVAFRKTTELLPEYAPGWGNLGAALGELSKHDEAEEVLKRAVRLDPASHGLHSNLGVTFRDTGKLDLAEAAFRTALTLNPRFAFGHYNLASVLFLAERYDEAIASFETARTFDRGRSARQSLMLAAARLAAGDVDGAHQEYRETFARLEGQMRRDMRTVAEWDLKELSRRVGVNDAMKGAAALLRELVD